MNLLEIYLVLKIMGIIIPLLIFSLILTISFYEHERKDFEELILNKETYLYACEFISGCNTVRLYRKCFLYKKRVTPSFIIGTLSSPKEEIENKFKKGEIEWL